MSARCSWCPGFRDATVDTVPAHFDVHLRVRFMCFFVCHLVLMARQLRQTLEQLEQMCRALQAD